MWTRSELKQKARQNVKTSWGAYVGVTLILFILDAVKAAGCMTVVIAILVGLLLSYPLMVGAARFYLDSRSGKASVGAMFSPYKSGSLLNIILTMFLRRLFISLWSILLVIPGIVKGYQYLMVPYILADDPSMGWQEALALSRKMMDGEKMNAFLLVLSFIPWFVLSFITCGILYVLYVGPYINAAIAELYAYNKVKIGS